MLVDDRTIRASKLTFFEDYRKDTGPSQGMGRSGTPRPELAPKNPNHVVQDGGSGRRSGNDKLASSGPQSSVPRVKKSNKTNRLKNRQKRKR